MFVLTSELSIGCRTLLLKRNRFLHMLVSFANVPQNSRLQALCLGIIFILGDVVVSFIEQSGRFVEAAHPPEVRIESGVVFEIFPIIDCRRHDLSDGFIDLIDCVFLRIFHFAAIGMRQICARMAKIGERVHIRGMPIRCGLRARAEDEGQRCCEHQSSCQRAGAAHFRISWAVNVSRSGKRMRGALHSDYALRCGP